MYSRRLFTLTYCVAIYLNLQPEAIYFNLLRSNLFICIRPSGIRGNAAFVLCTFVAPQHSCFAHSLLRNIRALHIRPSGIRGNAAFVLCTFVAPQHSGHS
jgi:hypothetical protein